MRKKRFLALLVTLVILLTGVCGCGDKEKQDAAGGSTQISTTDEGKDAQDRQIQQQAQQADPSAATQTRAEESEENNHTGSAAKGGQAAGEEGEPATGSSSGATSTAGTGNKSDDGQEEPLEQPVDTSVTCTVSVTCTAAYEGGYIGYGTILSGVSVSVEKGESVYDALLAAANAHGVSVSAEGGAFGVYISGIGGLYEKDCGKNSGWKYVVNGSYPSVSCSNYTLSGGENITFVYVV